MTLNLFSSLCFFLIKHKRKKHFSSSSGKALKLEDSFGICRIYNGDRTDPGSPAEAIVAMCHWAQLDLGHLQWSRNNLRLLSMTFTQEVSITVDGLWKCIFMCLFGGVCVVIMCVFQSSSTSWCQTEHPSPTILASCRLLSAVRRTGDCCLGDHYRGHKRAIYRTTSEWSQHSYLPPRRTAPCWVTNEEPKTESPAGDQMT